MTSKVKRGLGLLVVGITAWLIGLTLMQAEPSDGFAALYSIATALIALVMIGGILGGLVLIAWGLLRD